MIGCPGSLLLEGHFRAPSDGSGANTAEHARTCRLVNPEANPEAESETETQPHLPSPVVATQFNDPKRLEHETLKNPTLQEQTLHRCPDPQNTFRPWRPFEGPKSCTGLPGFHDPCARVPRTGTTVVTVGETPTETGNTVEAKQVSCGWSLSNPNPIRTKNPFL